ncbi:hypothetical protein ACWCQX_47770, partial [Streptomyces sp. NPDC002346]
LADELSGSGRPDPQPLGELPHGWASALLPQLMHLVSRQLPELSAAQAADVVVDTLLRGLGAS